MAGAALRPRVEKVVGYAPLLAPSREIVGNESFSFYESF
jgi:hypothetical protein